MAWSTLKRYVHIKHGIQSVGPLKALYASHGHTQADLFITTPTRFLWRSIQPYCNYSLNTIQSHISTTVYSTHLYSCVNWGFVERTKMRKFRNSSKEDSNPGSLVWGSAFYCWTTVPHIWVLECRWIVYIYIYIKSTVSSLYAYLAYNTAIKHTDDQLLYPEFVIYYSIVQRAVATLVPIACILHDKT